MYEPVEQERKRGVLSFSRPVWVLSLVSLAADISSELLYPIMPLYLLSIGYGAGLVGVLEGVAEAVAGLSKIYFGRLSDTTGRRASFVRAGYLVSCLARPLILLSNASGWIVSMRAADRVGKGLRTGARDAMLTTYSGQHERGRVFGFHRSMDSIGAVVGPLLGLIWLHYNPGGYATMFLVSVVPGLFSVGLTWLLPKDAAAEAVNSKGASRLHLAGFWARAGSGYRRLAGVLIVFALVNSADAFLLLKVREMGYSSTVVIGLYLLYNVSQTLLGLPVGSWADGRDKRLVLALGLLVFALVYTGIAFAQSTSALALIFIFYGLYAALTDGVGKAALSAHIPSGEKATGMGFYQGLSSLATLAASLWTGFLWQTAGAVWPLTISAGVAVVCAGWLLATRGEKPSSFRLRISG